MSATEGLLLCALGALVLVVLMHGVDRAAEAAERNWRIRCARTRDHKSVPPIK